MIGFLEYRARRFSFAKYDVANNVSSMQSMGYIV